jgi:hypothetical protein
VFNHYGLAGEHRLNTVKSSSVAQNENWLSSIARKRPTKTPCSLFSIDSPIPKLDLASSNPVSQSKTNEYSATRRRRWAVLPARDLHQPFSLLCLAPSTNAVVLAKRETEPQCPQSRLHINGEPRNAKRSIRALVCLQETAGSPRNRSVVCGLDWGNQLTVEMRFLWGSLVSCAPVVYRRHCRLHRAPAAVANRRAGYQPAPHRRGFLRLYQALQTTGIQIKSHSRLRRRRPATS